MKAMNVINTVTKQVKLPESMSENGFIAVFAIAALETIILTAIMKNYSIEVAGEVSKDSLKGGGSCKRQYRKLYWIR